MAEDKNNTDDDTELRPKLRQVEAVHYKSEGQDMFCLRDPLHYSDSQLHVSPDVFLIASLFDGEHDFEAVRNEFQQRFGAAITNENIEKVLEALAGAHLLAGPEFEEWREGVENAYRDKPIRETVLAGTCYPEDRRDIGDFLDKFFTRTGAPGKPGERPADAKPMRAMIIPHIDLQRGGVSFAHGYKALAEAKAPETVIILGVAHAGRGELFTLSKKIYETPLGQLEIDLPLVDRLAKPLGETAFIDEFVHKGEHSVEIQAVWLQHLYGENTPKIVPILCGSVRECIDNGTSPREMALVTPFVEELGAIIRESEGRVLVMASVDLAHIGQKFGDEVPLTPRLLRKNRDRDTSMLAMIQDGDGDAFFRFIRKEEDRRKVCGLTAIYALLLALEHAGGAKADGRLLHYDQSSQDETQSLVSYASIAFD